MKKRLQPIAVLVGLVVAFAVPSFATAVGLDIATSIVIFAILAVGLSLVVIQSGLPSLGHAAFFGLGAYAVALLAEEGIYNPWVVMLVAVGGAALFAVVLGPILLRTRAEYFLMATVAAGEILRTTADSWRSLTNGSDGLYGPMRPEFFGFSFADDIPFYYGVLVLLIIVVALVWALERSSFGHTVRAVRDNPRRVSALGVRTFTVEYVTLVVSAAIGGFAGMLFAYSNTFVAPSVFSLEISGTVLLMVAIFNSASVLAPVAGAVVIEGIRGFGSQYTDRWMLILGIVYILISIDAPRRIFRRKAPAPLQASLVGPDDPASPALDPSLEVTR